MKYVDRQIMTGLRGDIDWVNFGHETDTLVVDVWYLL